MTSLFVVLLSCSILVQLSAHPLVDEVISSVKKLKELNLTQALETSWFDVPTKINLNCPGKKLDIFTVSLEKLKRLIRDSCHNEQSCEVALNHLEGILGNIVQIKESIKHRRCTTRRRIQKRKFHLDHFLNVFESFLVTLLKKVRK